MRFKVPDWKKRKTMKKYNKLKVIVPKIKKRIERVLKAEGKKNFEISYNISEGSIAFKIKEKGKEISLPIAWDDALKKSPRYTGEVLGNLYLGKLNEFFGKEGSKL